MTAPLLFLAALPEEAEAVRAVLPDLAPAACPGFAGWIGGGAALAVAGVGKVEAAITATAAAAALHPVALVSVGVCGAIDPALEPGDVVLGQRVLQWDFAVAHDVVCAGDANLLRRVAAALPGLERAPRCRTGTIATGDYPVADAGARAELRARLGADVADMESAAVGRVAARLGLPFLAVRAVSDRAGAASLAEFRRHLPFAAASAAAVAACLVRSEENP